LKRTLSEILSFADEVGIRVTEKEDLMTRGNLAPLSPNEETTLRRVALGISKAAHLPKRDIDRLKALSLSEDKDGGLRLTTTGRERYRSLPKAAAVDPADSSDDPISTLVRFMSKARS
jgi:hypothetical protein